MKITKRKLSITLVLFSVIMLLNSFSTANASNSTPPVVYGTITNAFYTDLNNQSYYDIQYDMSFNITDFTSCNSVNGYYFTLLVGLQYPDGSNYWYQFKLVTYKQSFHLSVVFYDAVTQSGWYTAQSYTYSTYGHDSAYYSSLQFDPPRGGGPGSPI